MAPTDDIGPSGVTGPSDDIGDSDGIAPSDDIAPRHDIAPSDDIGPSDVTQTYHVLVMFGPYDHLPWLSWHERKVTTVSLLRAPPTILTMCSNHDISTITIVESTTKRPVYYFESAV